MWRRNKGSVPYDMTTLYFEAAQEDDLRKTGFSKDGKHSRPQIFLGLLVTTGGNPIGLRIYEGNIHEGKTLVPMIKDLAGRHGFDHPVVIADAGLLSKKKYRRLGRLRNTSTYLVRGLRVRLAEVKEAILGMNLEDGDVRCIDKANGVRLIVSMSYKRAAKDEAMRKKGLQRLEKRFQNRQVDKSKR